MNDWWGDLETEILSCLAGNGAMAPADIAERLRVPEGAATSLLAILAREGKIKICSVESTVAHPTLSPRESRGRRSAA